MHTRLEQWYDFALKHYAKNHEREHTSEAKEIDKWMEHQLHKSIKDATEAMDLTLFRTALMRAFFDLQRHLKWYIRRTAGDLNKTVLNDIIEAQTLMLQPFTPHLCEEIWSKLQKPGIIVNEKWPQYDENKIIPEVEQTEDLMIQVMNDITHVLKLAKVETPEKITLFVSKDWKAKLFKKLQEILGKTRNIGEIMKTVMAEFKDKASEVGPLVQKIVKDPSKMPKHVSHQEAEHQNLLDASEFLKTEYGCAVEIIKEQDSTEGKAKQALPGKPAILVK
jgi:leucyl-tRNA synthetase